MIKKVVIGADPSGFSLKEAVKAHLIEKGYEVTDLGMVKKDEPVMYWVAGQRVGKAVSTGEFERGLIFCGSGMGIHIAAGKFPHVHCALCESLETARRSRVANNCNILAMGGFYTAPRLACMMADAFLETEFCQDEDQAFYDLHLDGYEGIENYDYNI